MLDLENKDFLFSGGIFKAEAASDGGLNISGYATLEVPDKSNEIVDFPDTVAELQKWSEDTEQRSGGKSKGNLRVMHQLALGGKVTDLKAVKATVPDKNGKEQEVNAVLINGYVPPTLPDVIKNVQEGILNGFSIGGKYKARPVYDAAVGANRYTPVPTEISLVDNPCCPGADIIEAIQKAAGAPQKGNDMADIPTKESLLGKADGVVVTSSSNNGFDGSYDAITDAIYGACEAKYKGINEYWHGWVCRTFPDKAIVCFYDEGDGKDHYYFVPYTIDDKGTVTLGDKEEVQRITEYISVDVQKAIHDKLAKAADDSKSENDKLHDAAAARAKKYGIGVKEGGALTPPKDKPTNEAEYGDPTNYAYPIDGAHIQSAVSYFNHDGQQKAGGYTTEEWAKIGERIASAANKQEGDDKKYSFSDGKIQIEDKEAKKSMNPEDIRKAAEAAGLQGDALNAFVEQMTKAAADDGKDNEPDGKDSADKDEKEPDEKGDQEKCDKEADEKAANDPVKKAATAAGMSDEMLKTFTDELEKAGKTISDKTAKHINSIKAAAAHVMKAADALLTDNPLPDDQLFPAGMVSPVDDSNLDDAAKAANKEELTKAIGDELHKVGADGLTKAVSDVMDATKKNSEDIAEIMKLVKAIADTPVQSGPISVKAIASMLQPGTDAGSGLTADSLAKAIGSMKDPQDKEILSKTIGEPILKSLLAGK